jgi:hypothetical protein
MEVASTRHEALHTKDANESHQNILACLRSVFFELTDYLALETTRDMKLFEEVQHYVKNPELVKTTVEIKDSEESTDDSSVSMYSEDEYDKCQSQKENDGKPKSDKKKKPPSDDSENDDKEPPTKPKNDNKKRPHSEDSEDDDKKPPAAKPNNEENKKPHSEDSVDDDKKTTAKD